MPAQPRLSMATDPPPDILTLARSPRLVVMHVTEAVPSGCGAGGRSHVHQFFELVYIEGGEGEHRVGGRAMPVAAGDLFLVAPGELHDSSGLAPANRWIVAFGADALGAGHADADLFLDLPDNLLVLSFLQPRGTDAGRFTVPPADRPRWQATLARLQAELQEQRLGYAEAARALLILLLTDTARLAAPHLNASPATHPLLARVFSYIDAHYAEPISLRDVAAAVGHAPAYLTDLVRRSTGRTVLSWIVERRMAEARYLLLETEQSVGQIAQAAGYRTASHFIGHFRRLHGATPQTWRREQRLPYRKIAV